MWIFQLIPRLRLSSQDFDAIPDLNHVKTSRLLGRREPNGNTLVGSTLFLPHFNNMMLHQRAQ